MSGCAFWNAQDYSNDSSRIRRMNLGEHTNFTFEVAIKKNGNAMVYNPRKVPGQDSAQFPHFRPLN